MEAEQNPDSSTNPEYVPSIPEIFEGTCVLVTGATGFIGKVLVEKLLRSCPGIQELYVLIRPSEKGSVATRFEDFKEHNVFDKLRKDEPDTLKKIEALSGDITESYLGLNEREYHKVLSEVSIVFHCAGNMKLDDEPRNIIKTNVLGLENLLNVCVLCSKIKAIVHVSDIYPFGFGGEVREISYPELIHPRQLTRMLQWMTDEEFRSFCMHYIPNGLHTYGFSKQLAETLIHVLHDPVLALVLDKEPGTHPLHNSLPVIIVRPSTVTASIKEPFPGWIDNCNGPSGFFTECGKGLVRTLLVQDNFNADWVPVDTVANTLIAAAHYIARKSRSLTPGIRKKGRNELIAPFRVPIVHCRPQNVITWMKMMETSLPLLVQYPSIEVYRKPECTVTACSWVYNLSLLVSHYIPAVLIDVAGCLTLRKPTIICRYKSIHRNMSRLFFFSKTYKYISDNMKKLSDQMSPEDKEVFSIDLSTLNWTTYMENYVLGLRRFLLKEKDETLTKARTKLRRLHYSWVVLKISSMCGIFLLIALKNRD